MQDTNKSNTGPMQSVAGAASPKNPLTPFVVALGGLLAVQLIAAVVLSFSGTDLSPLESQGPLLAFEREAVTRVHIQGQEQDSLVLEKADGTWRIPSLGGFPATQIKIDDLLAKLGEIEKRIPVATSAAAIKRFKVTDDAYERRLSLEGADGELATLYLGDSPGFRRLFVRADGEQTVYEAELALFDASEKADDWTRKTALRIEQDDIQRVELADILLTRHEDSWSLAGLAVDQNLDQDAAASLIRTLANLNFRGVLGTENKPEYGQDAPVLTYRVTVGDETLEYRLSKLVEGDDHVLSVSNSPYLFRLSEFAAEDLIKAKAADLIAGGESEQSAGESEATTPESEPTAEAAPTSVAPIGEIQVIEDMEPVASDVGTPEPPAEPRIPKTEADSAE